ncbi:hypothetical protein KUH03_18830 [Sphingobacterium sp. E70]|uniref:hypothetical protein n=1 Tax=Sphingobacterium sp. E70 TaxID=2853439 RepID=UPI00211CC814|nr:hypothetical protein [Sphingobacterium sp. E70]ULT28427.1 hypothetical protein KUH03_18830 [Sphingobacterium sp. E70]
MKSAPKIFLALSLIALSSMTFGQQVISDQQREDVSRILNTLASDDMRGRSALTKDIEHAADFIAGEMKKIGLKPYAEESFRQSFQLDKLSPKSNSAAINKKTIPAEHIISLGNHVDLKWDDKSPIKIVNITSDADFAQAFREQSLSKENTLVLVDPSFEASFVRFGQMLSNPKFIEDSSIQKPSIVYLLTKKNQKHSTFILNEIFKTFRFLMLRELSPEKVNQMNM